MDIRIARLENRSSDKEEAMRAYTDDHAGWVENTTPERSEWTLTEVLG